MIISAVVTLGLVGFLFALLLAFLSKKLQVEEDPKVKTVLEIVPGLNCGACGFSGCRPFAEAVARESKIFNGCLPGGQEINDKISQILGITGCSGLKSQVVICCCGADETAKKISTKYIGPQTCQAAQITGGALDCRYGCFGFGDCLGICPVGALTLDKKKIKVDIAKCIGCGQCVEICPRNLFKITPLPEITGFYSVACSNKEKAMNVKKVCAQGCIACTICTRVPESPYYMKDNLSYIDYSKSNNTEPLQAGMDKCPTKCIVKLDG
ncbi:MAG: RnfABCDGE type electron transport complex subunit B [Candidatus Omnitrophica bacterium]|nr:RnfABCDGE type electron transport complex subunit B [Candidatus Omnitrophota bacterium]